MENRTDILNELKALSPVVAGIPNVNIFTVPEGYFEHLSTDIITGIKIENGITADLTDAASSEVPAGYFDTVAGSIMAKIKAEGEEDAASEIRSLSPMLYSIQNENVFEVPAGYFENVSVGILQQVKQETNKVVKMERRSSAILKYAVAAFFTGMMALAVFKFTSNTNAVTELPGYVTAGLQVENVDQELAKIANADIIQFLKSTGTDVEAAFVANSIDKNELPDQVEYLLDDQALDKYLDNINIQELTN